MGHHNPEHMKTDLHKIRELGCDDVFLAAQENDFVYMRGKVDFFPKIAKDNGIMPIAIFWGLLNYFGGGKSSQFLLDNPKAHQQNKDGSYSPGGCYNNSDGIAYIKSLIDRISEKGFGGYFIDEPSIIHCYCDHCRELYEAMHGGDLLKADKEKEHFFRKKCIVRYVCLLSDYIKTTHPELKTMCCIMPRDQESWRDIACIDSLDDLGTDIYWVNDDTDVEQMRPMIRTMSGLTKKYNKSHHQWIQAWGVKTGREQRIIDQGKILIDENPDAIYAWAYLGQLGTSETCEDPQKSWQAICRIFEYANRLK